MNIKVISDTHGQHHDFRKEDFKDIELIIHGGDASNQRSPTLNISEMTDFMDWYSKLDIPYKIYVAGNHDSSVAERLIRQEDFLSRGIIYLENEEVVINGIKIYGSPYSPSFGNWVFMKDRAKLEPIWANIPNDTDILITHTPPKGILDLSENRDGLVEQCGCKSLYNRVMKIQPKYHIFGHLHDYGNYNNSGVFKWSGCKTTFINASCVTDRKIGQGLSSRGQTIIL